MLIKIIFNNYNVRGMQKYLIEYKTNIMLLFPGVRQINTANELLARQKILLVKL